MINELMTKIDLLEISEDKKEGKFALAPLERGYGQTIGNSLRRIMLSSLEGVSASGIKIEGVHHEFSTITGVLEDVPEIILNLKDVSCKLYSGNQIVIHVDLKGPKVVTAEDFAVDADLEIINPEHYICTLNEGAKLSMDIEFMRGKGYRLTESAKKETVRDEDGNIIRDIETIPIDSSFTPVEKVNFAVENVRVGKITDYDRLLFDIKTNGTITPQEALSEAAGILISYLNLFIDLTEIVTEKEAEETQAEDMDKLLDTNIESLELSLRSFNCLKRANMHTVRDIVSKSKSEILAIKNFGKKSIGEVESKIEELGFKFKDEIEEE